MLRLENISKEFKVNGDFIKVIENINLNIKKGKLIVLLGSTGCGKTTLLKIIAKLVKQDSGKVIFQGKKIGLVSQNYDLFPWLTVRKNIGFGLKLMNISDRKRKSSITSLLKIIGLKDFGDSYPHELSGGMQQRVAIARSLAIKPDLLLMDEPFGSLDINTRKNMQDFLLDIQQKTGTTIIFVTHNIEEALFLGDEIYLLSFRPAKIINKIDNSLRKCDTKSTEFIKQEQKIMGLLKESSGGLNDN